MKTILALLILLSPIAMPAVAALTDADLNKIRLIVKEEIKEELKPIKAEIGSIETNIDTLKSDIGTLKEGVARLDGRMDGIEKQVSHATNLTYGLIALIVAAIGIPAWLGKKDRDQERKIEELRQEIETLKQQKIVGSP
ncbi:MAG: hypothetical protein OXI61_05320 [Candidatus Poribacteria bacterium]|nr:hypothetical protein [Candidatus Poribacteria bacterium]